jgi:predicted RNA binding protein YcfA (HicA-like mRNA interferase family)
MKQLSGPAVCKLLIKNGWELKRINGSHHIFIKFGRIERISVPVHGNKPIKLGLLKAILKIAEIKEENL